VRPVVGISAELRCVRQQKFPISFGPTAMNYSLGRRWFEIFSRVEWIIFDADNTLWDLEALYHNARRRLCRFLASLGFEQEEVEAYQKSRDVELFQNYGRLPKRFPQSFVDTLFHFRPAAKLDEIDYVWRLGTGVFESTACPYPGLERGLQSLGRYSRIGILTAGTREVQYRRLMQFPFLDLVDDWHIVARKDPASFQEYLDSLNINPYHSWMVGDSLRSDIIPARAVGLNTIWVETDNWDMIENFGFEAEVCANFKANGVVEAINLILTGIGAARKSQIA
jgi:putative hydrolase of the HAD superfamily